MSPCSAGPRTMRGLDARAAHAAWIGTPTDKQEARMADRAEQGGRKSKDARRTAGRIPTP
jgi:hypothetical protein